MTTVLPQTGTSAADGDPELVKLVQSLPRDSEQRNAACEKLIGRYESLVRACASATGTAPSRPRS